MLGFYITPVLIAFHKSPRYNFPWLLFFSLYITLQVYRFNLYLVKTWFNFNFPLFSIEHIFKIHILGINNYMLWYIYFSDLNRAAILLINIKLYFSCFPEQRHWRIIPSHLKAENFCTFIIHNLSEKFIWSHLPPLSPYFEDLTVFNTKNLFKILL